MGKKKLDGKLKNLSLFTVYLWANESLLLGSELVCTDSKIPPNCKKVKV